MRLSRMPVPLTILLFVGPPAIAQKMVTAEQALENHRRTFKPIQEIDCPTSTDPDEITVCGRRSEQDPNRLPLPVEREPGEPDLLPGEAPRASSTITNSCLRLCPSMVGVTITAAKF
jgi:hypothetical protein